MNRQRIIDRVKKLRRLAQSPNPHEADRAADLAQRLIDKYEIRPTEIDDAILQVADEQQNGQRVDLARVVAVSCRVSMLVNGHAIAFRGAPDHVTRAVNLYQHLAVHAQAHCELHPSDAPGRTVWRIFFWAGFTKAVLGRLGLAPPVPPTVTVSAPEPPPEPSKKVDNEAESALVEFAQHFMPQDVRLGIERLTQDAFDTGRRHGEAVSIELLPRDDRPGPVKGELVSSDTER